MGDMADMCNGDGGWDAWLDEQEDPSGGPYGYSDYFNSYLHNQQQIAVHFHKLIRETPKAWLIQRLPQADPWKRCEEWFPKSHCFIDVNAKEIRVPRWLLSGKGGQ